MNANTSIVSLSLNSNTVRFETAKDAPQWTTMHNSAGECATIATTEARARIATLLGAGWLVSSR